MESPTNSSLPSSPFDPMDQEPIPLPRGVYVPMPAFFTPEDEIDIPATQRHTARLLAAGVTGLVVHGSNGEAVHLSPRERRAIIEAVVDTVRHDADLALGPVPIIAGCSAQSVRETIALCREAREAGATHALILPPGYYRGLMTSDDIIRYYETIASSPYALPVVIYNFPPAANGVDLDSDVLLRLAAHPRIVGVKLTCGNTGKLARLAASAPPGFFVAGGSADFILQGHVVGAHGTISGLANLAPRACARIPELFDQGRLAEARELQREVARADWIAIKTGFVGVKAAMPLFYGPAEASCAVPRLPFTRLEEDGKAFGEIRTGMAGLLEVERNLALEAGGK
jgi:4-hydroxy-2-oxoglutarate aldolase